MTLLHEYSIVLTERALTWRRAAAVFSMDPIKTAIIQVRAEILYKHAGEISMAAARNRLTIDHSTAEQAIARIVPVQVDAVGNRVETAPTGGPQNSDRLRKLAHAWLHILG